MENMGTKILYKINSKEFICAKILTYMRLCDII